MRAAILTLMTLLLASLTAGCIGGYAPCDTPIDLSDTIVESSTADEVTYRVTVDGGPDNAGQEITLVGDGPAETALATGTTGTLDSAGKLTMRVTVPRTWDRAELQARLTSDMDKPPCGSFIANPELDVPATTDDSAIDAGPTTPTATPTPTSTPTPATPSEACSTHITNIETDREHYTGESDAIFKVHVAGDLPDGARVRGMVSGTPVEGDVVNGVAELRHRVYAYGDYTLTDIEIAADGCTHDHDNDAQTSATATVA